MLSVGGALLDELFSRFNGMLTVDLTVNLSRLDVVLQCLNCVVKGFSGDFTGDANDGSCLLVDRDVLLCELEEERTASDQTRNRLFHPYSEVLTSAFTSPAPFCSFST